MVDEHFTNRQSVIHNLDPRGRVIVAFAFAILIAIVRHPAIPIFGIAIGVSLAILARLPVWITVKRLAFVNVFMLMLVLTLPPGFGGRVVFSVGALNYSYEGLLHAGIIAAKCNGIVLIYTALLSTIEPLTLGHAFNHLRVPDKLIWLYFFTVRYLDILHQEYLRLRAAMKVRCFRARTNAHTYRSFGYLISMLLIHSFERSENIVKAMKCRGFRGKFYMFKHFAWSGWDWFFVGVSAVAIGAMVWTQWREVFL